MRTDKITTQKGENGRPKRKRRYWLIAFVFFVLLAAVAIATYFLLVLPNNHTSTTSKEEKRSAAIERLQEAINESSKGDDSAEASSGASDNINKLVSDAKKDAAGDDVQLTEVYMLEAANYYNNEDYNNALSSAKSALGIALNSRKSSIYQFMAYTYEKMGDKDSAVNYVDKAINSIDKAALSYEVRLEELNDMRAELQ